MKCETEIGENETAQELWDRLSVMGGELLSDTIKALKAGELKREKQDDSQSCYSPMIKKEMSSLDFSWDDKRHYRLYNVEW